jgi:hypothetical protein
VIGLHNLQIQGFLEAWVMGSQSVEYTPSGLAYLSPWGSLRHTSNAALIAASYSNLIASQPSPPLPPSNPSVCQFLVKMLKMGTPACFAQIMHTSPAPPLTATALTQFSANIVQAAIP